MCDNLVEDQKEDSTVNFGSVSKSTLYAERLYLAAYDVIARILVYERVLCPCLA